MPGAEPAAARLLRGAVAAGLWTRPYLLLGRGPAPGAAAAAFCRAVLCAGPRPEGEGGACGSCGPCGRFERGLHADFHRLVPEKGRVTVGVEAVESLQERLSLRPVEGRAAAALLPDAGALTVQAQNALLKTLEEPPPRTAVVLVASAPRSLLGTVRSRCAVVRFPPIPAPEVRAGALRAGSTPEEAAVLAIASGGDPEGLEAARAEGAAAAAAILARAFAPSGRGGTPGDALDAAAGWVRGKGGTLEEQRDRLRMGLRLLLALHHPPGAGGPATAGEGLAGIGPRARRARLAALGEARERVERYVDPAGILEGLAGAFVAADAGGPPSRETQGGLKVEAVPRRKQ